MHHFMMHNKINQYCNNVEWMQLKFLVSYQVKRREDRECSVDTDKY